MPCSTQICDEAQGYLVLSGLNDYSIRDIEQCVAIFISIRCDTEVREKKGSRHPQGLVGSVVEIEDRWGHQTTRVAKDENRWMVDYGG